MVGQPDLDLPGLLGPAMERYRPSELRLITDAIPAGCNAWWMDRELCTTRDGRRKRTVSFSRTRTLVNNAKTAVLPLRHRTSHIACLTPLLDLQQQTILTLAMNCTHDQRKNLLNGLIAGPGRTKHEFLEVPRPSGVMATRSVGV